MKSPAYVSDDRCCIYCGNTVYSQDECPECAPIKQLSPEEVVDKVVADAESAMLVVEQDDDDGLWY